MIAVCVADTNASVGFEALAVCAAHSDVIASRTRLFSLYFPLLLRHVAWTPEPYAPYAHACRLLVC
jgi:hypothetical protein